MKKLVYISFVDFNNNVNIGVKNKILSQIKTLREEFSTTLYTFNGNNIYCENDALEIKQTTISKLFKRKQFLSFIYKDMHDNLPDYIYMRYQFSDLYLYRLFRKLNNIKIYVEIPTYPYYNELKLQGIYGLIKAIVDYIFHFLVFKNVKKIITYSKHEYIYKTNTIRLINGVDFNSIPLSQRKASPEIRLIAVSSLKPWHGYDRLIKGLKEYYNKKNNVIIKITIVGTGVEYNKYVNMVNDYSLGNYIKFTGVKSGEELNRIFDNSDIAVSSLALHRLNLISASTLKIREYAARGLPVIIASKEDIEIDSKYILNFNSNEIPIDMEKVIDFYNSIYVKSYNKDYAREIRKSIKSSCDIRNAFFPVIKCLKEEE